MSNNKSNEKEVRLLKAIFAKENDEKDEDDYPQTLPEKVSFSEMIVTGSLQGISRTIMRLSRLNSLLAISDKEGQPPLPDIITHNEVRMALEPLLTVGNDISEVVEILTEIYRNTKPPKKESEDTK